MKNLPPSEIAKKWANNLAAATNNITAGVRAVTTSPTEKAAQRADAYVQGVMRAVQTGRYQQGLRRVTLQQWQDAMISKGIPRIAGGATQAIPKFTQFMQRWMAYQRQIQSGLQQYPRGSLEQNIQRMVYVVREAAKFNAPEQLPFPNVE